MAVEYSSLLSLVLVILKLVVIINGSSEEAHSCGDLIGIMYDTIYITFALDVFVCVNSCIAYIFESAVFWVIVGILQLISIVYICIPWGQYADETVLFYTDFYTGPNNCTDEYALANGVYKTQSFLVMLVLIILASAASLGIICMPCYMCAASDSDK